MPTTPADPIEPELVSSVLPALASATSREKDTAYRTATDAFKRRRMPLFRRRFTKPGAPPGRFAGRAVPGSARLRTMRHDGAKWHEQENVSIAELPTVDPQRLIWFDLRGVQDHDAVKALGEHLKLHPLAIADVVNIGQRPKAESYEADELFIVLRMAVRESVAADASDNRRDDQAKSHPIAVSMPEVWRWEQFALFIGEGFVATFQEADGDCLDGVRRRMRQNAFVQPPVVEAGGLAAAILDAIVDNYFPLLEHVSDRLETIEDRVVEHPERAILTEIYQVKRDLLAFRRSAWPLRDVLGGLVRDSHPLVSERIKPFLRDTADHAVQVVDVLESYRELAASFIDVYLSSISYQTNEVMRVLTIISTIFIPLTFLAGVYGMNFDVLPELHWAAGYGMFWVVCLAITASMLVGFWRLGWIGRGGRRSTTKPHR